MHKILTLVTAIALASLASAQGIIDVHSHIIPTDFVSYLERHNATLDEGFPLPQ